ncbi:DUF72 domain-containing protein [Flavobacterium aquicola]|uniref:Uncharacterized protein YecE (DUF72 family) n=1 Tax=Flavobacterium aquicola TaxID=1682742 RepID=A0A3E0ESZ1_9FLAO|nr:DUF72 domain-containing protein [Flavobacterium aquicola]REH00771.1 uncharacterized protein YecE (DUF72 family) [Flavobacterium aquicola]
MKKNTYIGCSSFSNSYWKKIFYPENMPSSKWFEYYCTHFNTYEMNGTFYKFPTLKTMDNWYKKAPEHFLFSVKAPRDITHYKKFVDCEEQINDFYAICDNGLKDKLGPILFQLPPSYQYSEEKLLSIIKQLDQNFDNIIEFRHPSWWIPEVWTTLDKNNITFCSVSHPQLPETIFTEFPVTYIRLHGRPTLFYSDYAIDELNKINDIISQNTAKPSFIYFNNTASTAGILNAIEMKKLSQQND